VACCTLPALYTRSADVKESITKNRKMTQISTNLKLCFFIGLHGRNFVILRPRNVHMVPKERQRCADDIHSISHDNQTTSWIVASIKSRKWVNFDWKVAGFSIAVFWIIDASRWRLHQSLLHLLGLLPVCRSPSYVLRLLRNQQFPTATLSETNVRMTFIYRPDLIDAQTVYIRSADNDAATYQ